MLKTFPSRAVLGALLLAAPLGFARSPMPAPVDAKAEAKGETAAPMRISAAVLPVVERAPGGEDRGILIQSKAAAILAGSGRYNDFHIKQIVSMSERHGLPPGELDQEERAVEAARHLGATHVVFGSLEADGTLKLTALETSSGKRQTAEEKLPAGLAAAVSSGGVAVAKLLAGLDGVPLLKDASRAEPFTSSDKAMKSYAACLKVVVGQKMGIENPPLLDAKSVARASADCGAAVKADGAFASAHAALAMARALAGEDDAAVASLNKVEGKGRYVPMFHLARFWLVSRHKSPEQGAVVLEQALQKWPGMLLARGFLGDLLDALGQYEQAVTVWEAYRVEVPKNPFVLGQLSASLAHAGKHDQAVTRAAEALELDPAAPEAQLEMGSRLIDSGQFDAAAAALEGAEKQQSARAEVTLRLGYAYLLQGKLDDAEARFRDAFERGKQGGDWRVRVRARNDLALVALARRDLPKAKLLAQAAVKAGYRPSRPPPELVALLPADEAPSGPAGQEASPLKLNAEGGIQVDSKKGPTPKGLDALSK